MTPKALWTLAITSAAVFMVTLDNLVVTTAIPVIREDLHASLSPGLPSLRPNAGSTPAGGALTDN